MGRRLKLAKRLCLFVTADIQRKMDKNIIKTSTLVCEKEKKETNTKGRHRYDIETQRYRDTDDT